MNFFDFPSNYVELSGSDDQGEYHRIIQEIQGRAVQSRNRCLIINYLTTSVKLHLDQRSSPKSSY